jgi:hypothetical protein
MTRETTYKGTMGDLERLIAALFANAGELTHLEGARLQMEQLLESVRETAQEQAELIAAKQDASRRLLAQVGHGARMATAVRKLLKAHYGLDAEKLAEFGIQPFRGRTRRAGPAQPPETGPTIPPIEIARTDPGPTDTEV